MDWLKWLKWLWGGPRTVPGGLSRTVATGMRRWRRLLVSGLGPEATVTSDA